ncbi:carbon-monoxide dehydrogenase medium subunit/6-hydroxypseudooxynicotine dehydrogenase subunit alpha [Rhodococcus rhodochrous J45]|uniref:Carbon-monoxide dehydrogenase medium subunit/6-hydroxypseudooxynicotine dehydrogenase subunit alpha n=1 Tax=Rhodococcus rhodochrous J45 TaxID=935266 RepID=A0A562E2W6_RHORH|nr:xanthine dehydrogenase family protein subunit M [Rhodococcus rhodochrous]TWH16107.1 carbon-monoxide dehydrogenase medium subunit/6-hydroxypseudooxynicotine dehydrogenase subunit alpha [Rhodococcus rhodochrous J45]
MKPSVFEYLRPESIDEALRMLAEDPDDSKILAGGQSLIPVLNFRMASPERLIDINRLTDLAYLRSADGELRIGALTRHAMLEKSGLIERRWPLLKAAAHWVAHAAIRNRGTIGGSVSHADSAAELPVALTALNASIVARSSTRGARLIPASEFFVGTMTTAMEPDEILVEIRVPALPAGHGYAFEEISRRNGDFGLAGAGVVLSIDAEGKVSDPRISLLGAAQTPLRATEAEERLAGAVADEQAIDDAVRLACEAAEPIGDLHGSADYRRSLIGVVVRRGINNAVTRAKAGRDATPQHNR